MSTYNVRCISRPHPHSNYALSFNFVAPPPPHPPQLPLPAEPNAFANTKPGTGPIWALGIKQSLWLYPAALPFLP
jgi:hypothetical protein